MCIESVKVIEGIVIGGVGGAIAGLTVWIIDYLHKKTLERTHMRRVYLWLKANTEDKANKRYRSTRAIASHNNLTLDRIRYICSYHDQIFLSTGEEEDMWSIYGVGRGKGVK